jgi:SlyX protein
MPMSREPDERIMQLEIQLAHAQHMLEQLNQVVTEQALKVDRVTSLIQRLNGKVEDLKFGNEEKRDLLDEKPPHY